MVSPSRLRQKRFSGYFRTVSCARLRLACSNLTCHVSSRLSRVSCPCAGVRAFFGAGTAQGTRELGGVLEACEVPSDVGLAQVHLSQSSALEGGEGRRSRSALEGLFSGESLKKKLVHHLTWDKEQQPFAGFGLWTGKGMPASNIVQPGVSWPAGAYFTDL